ADQEKFLTKFAPDVAAALPGAEWLRSRRVAAAERFAAASLPTEAEEIWRYSRIGQFDLDAYTPATSLPMSAAHGIPAVLEAAMAAAGERSALAIVHNGRIVHIEVDPALEAKGLAIGDVGGDAEGEDLLGDVAASTIDAFTELNTAFAPGCLAVRAPAGLEVDRPILVFHWIDGEGSAVFPRTIVRAGADADVTIVEHQVSADIAAFVDPVVELDVAAAARVRYLNLQDLGPRVWQTGYQASRVAQDATLRSSVVALGGYYARVRTDSQLVGKGGTSYLTAVYFADGERMHDFRTVQDHAAPSTTSDLLFKGAAQDTGRSVYSGLIRVRKEARGTNAFQTNRNLVLSEGAGAESVPNLEIETDDVRCSHASAVGPIDDEHLYYLESRGVPPEVAERLIVLGFFGEVLDRLPTPSLVDTLRATIAGRLTAKDRR
ncbi:MAG: Fe-S cluster assembly protein SufD, partial [Actinomycetota bacterium]|nr:Fe-S cluster assembly protein SufD [Actinomycetota bacterium]